MTWPGFAKLLGLRPVQPDVSCFCDQPCAATGMGPAYCKRRYDDAFADLIDYRDLALAQGYKMPPIERVEDRCDRRGLPVIRVRAGMRPV